MITTAFIVIIITTTNKNSISTSATTAIISITSIDTEVPKKGLGQGQRF